MSDANHIEKAVQAMASVCMPAGCAIAVSRLENLATTALFPAESAACAGAQLRRQLTFRGGRACVRTALGRLGVPPTAIPADASGAPVWPAGFVGSISHTDEIAAAVVAHCPPVRGIGLDLETDGPLDDATMVQVVCRPEELPACCNPGDPASRLRGKLLFVIKEAVYKLCWPFAHTFLDFHDLQVSLDEEAGTFHAALVEPGVPDIAGIRVIHGHYTHAAGLAIALTAYRTDSR